MKNNNRKSTMNANQAVIQGKISGLFKQLYNYVKTMGSKVVKVCKKSFSKSRNNSPHYLLRAFTALGCSLYLLYLLKCFLTIPVKDYYIDIYSVSPDSVVAQVDLTIGHDNLLNTYSRKNSLKNDSFNVMFECFKFQNPINRKNRYYQTHDAALLSKAMDSIYSLSTTDSYYNPLLKTYNHHLHNGYLERDTMSTYIYTHLYENLSSSVPIGYVESKKDSIKFITPINIDSKDIKNNNYNILIGGGVMSPFICSMNLSLFSDSASCKKLSKNHDYLNIAQFVRVVSQSNLKNERKPYGISYGSTTVSFTFSNPKPNYLGLYRFFPHLSLLLYKEDISQAFFRFSLNSRSIDSYTINLHSRSGAVVQNNPSDELKVLSLHDTQIKKNKLSSIGGNYTDTELFITFPENSNIQYIRLFFVTLVIGWLILSFCRNIWKRIEPQKNNEQNIKES